MKKYSFLSLLMIITVLVSCNTKPVETLSAYAEFVDTIYWKTVSERAGKIVGELQLEDSVKGKVQDLVAAQYYRINGVYDTNKACLDSLVAVAADSLTIDSIKVETSAKIDAIVACQTAKIDSLQAGYLAALSAVISPEQVDAVKDGMTYGVAPKTFEAFQQMIPELTDDQKAFIQNSLNEAREIAMTKGSSEEKHSVFGQYKGKINNFLSEQGYDLAAKSKEWEEKLKAEGVQL
ncbi:MAG: DUF3826 domain-containing protein [Mangrovibacterium sp.]